MATANTYHGYCCKCGAEVQAGLGRIRRYSGANKRSAPAGSRSRRTNGYNGGDCPAVGKYAVWCIPCDDADQQAKRQAAKAERDFAKVYRKWNDAHWALHAEYSRLTQLCCAARDSGDAQAWHDACVAQDTAKAAWREHAKTSPARLVGIVVPGVTPAHLTHASPSVQDTSTSLPGHERPGHWFDTNTNGYGDDNV